MIYHGEFRSKDDVEGSFRIKFNGLVLYASYDCPDYDGYANVIYVHEGKLFYVEGSHCSCYGLEDQWSPEETTIDVLAHMITKSTSGSMSNDRAAYALEVLRPALERQDFDEIMVLATLLS